MAAEVELRAWRKGEDIDLSPGYYFGVVCPLCLKRRWCKAGSTTQKYPDGIAPCNDCRHNADKEYFSKLLRGKRP